MLLYLHVIYANALVETHTLPSSTDSLIFDRNPSMDEIKSLFHSLEKRGMDLDTAVEGAMSALEQGGWEAFASNIREKMGI